MRAGSKFARCRISAAGLEFDTWYNSFTNLPVVAGLLAIGDPLHLRGGGEVQGLTQVGEAERSGYPHVCQRQVVHIQQRP